MSNSQNENIAGEREPFYSRLAFFPAGVTVVLGGSYALAQCGVCPPQDVVWPIPLAIGIVGAGRLADRIRAKRGEVNE